MKRTVFFHGGLADQFGIDKFDLDVDTPVMLMNALNSQIKGWREFSMTDAKIGIVLTDADDKEPVLWTPSEAHMPFSNAAHVHFVPEVEGAGIETVAFLGYTGWAAVGAYVAVSVVTSIIIGIATKILAPTPSTTDGGAQADQKPSFLYNGAVNVVEQGYPVPLIFGIHTTGSIQISTGVDVEDISFLPEQATDLPTFVPAEPWQYTGAA